MWKAGIGRGRGEREKREGRKDSTNFFMVYLMTCSVAHITPSVKHAEWFNDYWIINCKGRGRSWSNLRYYTGICLEALRKNTKKKRNQPV
jgi:hypothetical protein